MSATKKPDPRCEISHADNRGDKKHQFGFIYFARENYGGQDVRMGYMGGKYDPAQEADTSLHDVDRYSPYVFTGNWGEPSWYQIKAAWEFCVENEIEGFAEYAAEHPNDVRWMNGGEYHAIDKAMLEIVALREHQSELRKSRRSSKSIARG